MKWQSAYWKCNNKNRETEWKCDEPLTITLDLGPPLEIVEGHLRVPVMYAQGCEACGYVKNSRLMLINPWTDDSTFSDLKGGKS